MADAIFEKRFIEKRPTQESKTPSGMSWSSWCRSIASIIETSAGNGFKVKSWPKVSVSGCIVFPEPSSYRDATSTPMRVVRMPGKGVCASRAIYFALDPARLERLERDDNGVPKNPGDQQHEDEDIADMLQE
jgi:hypothetical protein